VAQANLLDHEERLTPTSTHRHLSAIPAAEMPAAMGTQALPLDRRARGAGSGRSRSSAVGERSAAIIAPRAKLGEDVWTLL